MRSVFIVAALVALFAVQVVLAADNTTTTAPHTTTTTTTTVAPDHNMTTIAPNQSTTTTIAPNTTTAAPLTPQGPAAKYVLGFVFGGISVVFVGFIAYDLIRRHRSSDEPGYRQI